jgi:hypothetical protein
MRENQSAVIAAVVVNGDRGKRQEMAATFLAVLVEIGHPVKRRFAVANLAD